jgi:phage I-like protein
MRPIEPLLPKSSSASPRAEIVCHARSAEVAADGWVQLLPAGKWHGRDGRGPYSLEDAQAVVTRSMAQGMDLPVDRDHATDLGPAGAPNPAMGWVREMQARDDGIWGRVEWTPVGRQLLDNREYRYLSPVFKKRASGAVDTILRAGLTNNPNFPLRELASQETSGMDLEQQLREALGLAEGVDAPGIVTAARRAVERAAAPPDPARFVPVEQYQEVASQLASLQAGVAQEAAEREVATAIAAGKLSPAQRPWATAYAGSDLDGFKKFVAAAPVIVAAGQLPGRPAPTRRDAALSPQELTICASLGLKPEDYMAQREKEAV